MGLRRQQCTVLPRGKSEGMQSQSCTHEKYCSNKIACWSFRAPSPRATFLWAVCGLSNSYNGRSRLHSVLVDSALFKQRSGAAAKSLPLRPQETRHGSSDFKEL